MGLGSSCNQKREHPCSLQVALPNSLRRGEVYPLAATTAYEKLGLARGPVDRCGQTLVWFVSEMAL